jgi:xanthine dehydrogenase accessory factor
MSDYQIFKRLNSFLSEGKMVVLCTITGKKGSGPREPGAKMLIGPHGETFGTIGGGDMERQLIEKALEVMRNRIPKGLSFSLGLPMREGVIPVNSKCCGGVKVFMDLIKPEPRLIIFGSGLIAQAVARYAKDCSFEVIIVDDAKTAKKENFKDILILNGKYPESLNNLDIKPSDCIAILHGETKFEIAGLRFAVEQNPAYIGLLGSTNKRKSHVNQLLKEGFTVEVVEKIKGPIGIDIKAKTPEEIGVSIIAELIQLKNS